jgi:hypothetical protein
MACMRHNTTEKRALFLVAKGNRERGGNEQRIEL